MSDKRYIVDANVLIVAKNDWYPFGLNVSTPFWQVLRDAIIAGRIVLIDRVKEELEEGNDELAEWSRNLPNSCILATKRQNIIENYGRVLDFIQQGGYYKPSALELWAKEEVADPWIIATAMSTELSVITTNEKGKVTLDRNMPSKEAKIPNVAQHFGISVCSLVDVLRDLQISED